MESGRVIGGEKPRVGFDCLCESRILKDCYQP